MEKKPKKSSRWNLYKRFSLEPKKGQAKEHFAVLVITFISKSVSTALPKCMKNKPDHVIAELDSNTLVFNSLPTSVACVSDMNALAGLCCAVD